MSDQVELYKERQGRLFLKNPNIVDKDGVILREDVVYECPCKQRVCVRPYVSMRTFHDHMARARENAKRNKKEIPGRNSKPYARYIYRSLTGEEGKEALQKLKKIKALNSTEQVRSETPGVSPDDLDYLL